VFIRAEKPDDYGAVAEIHRLAFGSHGDVVAALVDDLRTSIEREGGLSLVATSDDDGEVLGHVMFTRNRLDAPARLVDVQVLSPVGVLPRVQRQGVGTRLVEEGLALLAQRGVPLVFLEGSPVYYARFGFEPGAAQGFHRPSLRIPEEAFQVRRLPAHQPWMTGQLIYREAFWDHDCVGLRDET
jgi:putative acetyltransferase